jgi:rod shape determining protein RodA
MMYNGGNATEEQGKVDKLIVLLYLLFVVLGWLNIYAASFNLENAAGLFDLSTRAGSQLIWIGTSLLIAFALLKIDVSFYETYAFLFYLVGIALLVLTLIVAEEINGSRSWLILGPVHFQPAEFMKFIIALTLARVFTMYGFKLMEAKNFLLVSAIILLPAVLVILQKETGTALVYLSFILVMYREGLPGRILFMGFAAILYFILGIRFSEDQLGMLSLGELIAVILIILFSAGLLWNYLKRHHAFFRLLLLSGAVFLIAFAASLFSVTIDWGLTALIALGVTALSLLFTLIFLVCSFAFLESSEYVFLNMLQPHQQMRIEVLLGMEQDLSGAGYHVGQSKIAIGSGGLTGKGFLNGTQTKLKYVPEQDTDFIFCTIGEEHGFIGSTLILILFTLFVLRILHLAERQPSVFGRVYGYGVASIFMFHLLINIGMVIGIMPVIGIPLPFFSYGGSSLWGFTILLFIFLRIDSSSRRR